jgi:hypothetical protein
VRITLETLHEIDFERHAEFISASHTTLLHINGILKSRSDLFGSSSGVILFGLFRTIRTNCYTYTAPIAFRTFDIV